MMAKALFLIAALVFIGCSEEMKPKQLQSTKAQSPFLPSPSPGPNPSPSPSPSPLPSPSPGGSQLPLPNGYGIVEQVANTTNLIESSCENNEFLFEVVRRLRATDSRWGLNWKRGNIGDMSQDVVTYHYGSDNPTNSTNVYIIDIIGGHCGDNPQPAWIDVTEATRNGGTIGRWTIDPLP